MLKFQRKTRWITFQYERLPKFCFHCGVIIHGRTECPKRNMMRQQNQPLQFGLWLRASSPTRRNEKEYGRHAPRWETPFYDGGEGSQTSVAEGGGQFSGAGGGAGEDLPTPKLFKFQKETDGDKGMNQGGVVANFLSKVQKDMASFQTENRNEKQGMRGKGEQGKQNRGSGSTQSRAVNNIAARFVDEMEGEYVWGRKGAGGPKFTSPTKSPSSNFFTRPVLADMERTMLSAKGYLKDTVDDDGDSRAEWARAQEGEQNEGNSFPGSLIGLEKKRKINGEVKQVGTENESQNVQINLEYGSGLAVAVEQPHRPQ